MNFPDCIKDPADVVLYPMDWSSRLPAGVLVASASISVNGDCTVVDKTTYPAPVLALWISGGSDTGWTGDPQIATLSVVTVTATWSDDEVLARSFNVVERNM